jgi:hypothetical protein
LPQFMATLGICIGYFSCYGTSGLDSSMAWRLPLVIPVVVGVVLTLACFILPESPRWLMMKGRAADANTALILLQSDMEEARRDILTAAQEQPSLSRWQTYAMLFRRPYRLRTFLSLFFLAMIQLSGIDAITYYAPRLFEQARIASTNSSLIASGVSSITMFLISIPAFMMADKWNRRTSAISGGIALCTLMLIMGSLYAADAVTSHGVARWVIVVCVFMFGMVYCATWNIVAKIYASEIQPAQVRAAGNSIGSSCSYLANWFVAFITPILLDASASGAYFLFAGVVFLTVVVLSFIMPETRGRSLENIQAEFRHPGMAQISTLLQRFGLRRRQRGAQASSPETRSENIELHHIEQSTSANTTATASGVGVMHGVRMDIITPV